MTGLALLARMCPNQTLDANYAMWSFAQREIVGVGTTSTTKVKMTTWINNSGLNPGNTRRVPELDLNIKSSSAELGSEFQNCHFKKNYLTNQISFYQSFVIIKLGGDKLNFTGKLWNSSFTSIYKGTR